MALAASNQKPEAVTAVRRALPKPAGPAGRRVDAARVALAEAAAAGLLDNARTCHLSFRVPAALLEAAQRETGLTSPTELGVAALAMLAQRDPFVEFMQRTDGCLGPDHTLEY